MRILLFSGSLLLLCVGNVKAQTDSVRLGLLAKGSKIILSIDSNKTKILEKSEPFVLMSSDTSKYQRIMFRDSTFAFVEKLSEKGLLYTVNAKSISRTGPPKPPPKPIGGAPKPMPVPTPTGPSCQPIDRDQLETLLKANNVDVSKLNKQLRQIQRVNEQ